MNLKMENNYNGADMILFFGAVILAFFVVIAVWLNNVVPFLEKRKYIKMEMERSTDSHRYRYWKRELKKLYLHSIPIIGRLLRDLQ